MCGIQFVSALQHNNIQSSVDLGPNMFLVARRLVLLTQKLSGKKKFSTYLHSGPEDSDVKTIWRDSAASTDEYFSVAEHFHNAFTALVAEAVNSESHCNVLFAELKDPVRCVCVCVCVYACIWIFVSVRL